MQPTYVKERPTARLLLTDQQNRVLLFKFEDEKPFNPAKPELLAYWMTPGGGLEEAETYEQAAKRELWEETGISDAEIGACVWFRQREIERPSGRTLFKERYFVTRVISSDISLENAFDYERDVYRTHHWWTLAEIKQTQDVILPEGFTFEIEPILRGHIPGTPIDISKYQDE